MTTACLLSWLLVSLMPVMNAHSSNSDVWESICTFNGFKLVKVGGEETNGSSHGTQCPFSHYTPFHLSTLHSAISLVVRKAHVFDGYSFTALSHRYVLSSPRSPPSLYHSLNKSK